MKFDGTPIRCDAPFYSTPKLSPPDEIEDDIKIDDFLISSGHGIYIPQMFTELFEKREEIPDWAWDTCKKGPPNKDDSGTDNYDYWDAWTEILDKWEYFSYEGHGNTYKYFLDRQNGDLCLMRQFIDHDLD